jgi:preprotein translocase subunit YajC
MDMHLNCLNLFLAQATAPAGAAAATPVAGATPTPAQGLFGSPLVLVVLMGVMVYFMMIRPQSQRAKQQKKMLAALKSGDKVATAAGIVGVVITVKDATVSLRSADAKMEVTKDSITQILESANTAPTAS